MTAKFSSEMTKDGSSNFSNEANAFCNKAKAYFFDCMNSTCTGSEFKFESTTMTMTMTMSESPVACSTVKGWQIYYV